MTQLTDMKLSESYRSTILRSLAHENSHAAIETIKELKRIGWNIPTWISEDINRYDKIASWRTFHLDDYEY